MKRVSISLILLTIIILVVIIGFTIHQLNQNLKIKQSTVLFTRVTLSRGNRITFQDIYWKTIPKSTIKPMYFTQDKTQLNRIKGSIVLRNIRANQPLTRNDIIQVANENEIPYATLLKPGMRAISLPIQSSVTTYLLQPGDRVDLVLTYSEPTEVTTNGDHHRRRKGTPQMIISKTLLVNILVLGIYPQQEKQTRFLQLGTTTRKWVTLEVTPKQVELITTALKIGTISLSLKRQMIGIGTFQLPSVTTSQTVTGKSMRIITIIRGAQTQNVIINQD